MECCHLNVKDVGKVVCVGRNYKAHCLELGNSIPKIPILFLKPSSSIKACEYDKLTNKCLEGTISLPSDIGDIHYEVELAVVIGEEMCCVSPKEALKKIKGYSIALDLTAREYQKKEIKESMPWTLSKCRDEFLPFCSSIATDKNIDYKNIEIYLKINEKDVQRANTNDMIFEIPNLLSYISSVMTLQPNDVLITGTPKGVGKLSPGQKLEFGFRCLTSNVERKCTFKTKEKEKIPHDVMVYNE